MKLSKVEEWILSAMAMEHFRMKAQRNYGELIWNVPMIVDSIPQVYYDEMESSKNIRNALINLINARLVDSRDPIEPHCIINADGIFAFRKFLSPLVKTMENKKAYKKILEETPGNPKIREELKKLPDLLKDRIVQEGVDALLKIGTRYGLEIVYYLIELTHHIQ